MNLEIITREITHLALKLAHLVFRLGHLLFRWATLALDVSTLRHFVLGNFLESATLRKDASRGTDRGRLEDIVPLFKGEPLAKASLGDCLHKVFPGVDTDKALTDFRAFRSRLNGNAQDAARHRGRRSTSRRISSSVGTLRRLPLSTNNFRSTKMGNGNSGRDLRSSSRFWRRVHPVDADYPPVEPKEIVRLVKEEGALIIFDGLDEKIVHLSSADAGNFIKELWKVLPVDSRSGDTLVADEAPESPLATGVSPLLEGSGGGAAPPKRGRLIISCRSHYFQDVWNQQAMLTGNDRAPVKAKHYKAAVMLPFGDEQITSYITQVFGEKRTASIRELMKSVHNLSELAQRPYLLSVIAENVERLETLRAQGRTVSAVTLYDLIVKRWLLRDDGKHTFSPHDKVRLMEDLAAAMWKSGAREWKWDTLEGWMRKYLVGDPIFASRYQGDKRDQLEEDLRTATFVLRRDDSEESFVFAHRSLQEYFLACVLMRSLGDGVLEGWDIAGVSWETLDFFLQLLAQHVEEMLNDTTWRATWNALLETHRPHGSLLAFRAWLMARDVARDTGPSAPDRQNLAAIEPNPQKSRFPATNCASCASSGRLGLRFPWLGRICAGRI